MIYLMLDVKSFEDTEKIRSLHAWVNVTSVEEALSALKGELRFQGWSVCKIIEASPTSEVDYFPPCTSLDAFREAQQDLLAIRFL